MSSSVLGWDSPAPTGNRFAVVTPDNHSAWIWLPTLLALVYSFCFLVLRGIVKLKRYGVDDAIIVVAYVFALCHWITTFVALHNGLGRSSLFLKDAQEQSVSKNLFAGRIFLLIALCLSKCTIILLIRQVFTHELKTAWRTCNISLGILAAWCLLAVMASSASCSAEHVLAKDDSSLCPNQASRWKLIIILDAFTELCIVVLLCGLLFLIQMRLSRKVLVVVAFAFRLPNIVFSVIYLHTYLNHLKRSAAPDGDPSLSIALPYTWLESALAYSLISATIPCLITFMKKFQTGGMGFTRIPYWSGGRAKRSKGSGKSYSNGTGNRTTGELPSEWYPLNNTAASFSSKRRLRGDNGSRVGDSLVEDGSII